MRRTSVVVSSYRKYGVPSIASHDDLVAWIADTFSSLTPANVEALLEAYDTAGTGPGGTSFQGAAEFATSGTGWPTASDVSLIASGAQQRAYNMYAEATFVCPAYYLAGAFETTGKAAFQYQYSVPHAGHGADTSAYLGTPTTNQGPSLADALRRVWGGVVVRSDPSLADVAFAPWSANNHTLVSLNTTGGTPTETNVWGSNRTLLLEPGLQPAFKTADADAWEGGRGARCAFWKSLAMPAKVSSKRCAL